MQQLDYEEPMDAGAIRVEGINRLANYSKPEPCIEMGVRILDEIIQGQVDTGATFTCIDYKFYDEKLSGELDLLANDGLVMHGANGRAIGVKGIVKLPVQYEDKYRETQRVTIRVVILEELATRLLLGRDFMFGANMIIDHEAKRIYCGEPR